ncbi:MAG: hypothetical protein JSS76_06650 [Bacteroidetes bacterium]|nr:hypothetical protein [Bacteroidota bacterium]
MGKTTEEIFRPLNERLFEIKNGKAKSILDNGIWIIDQLRIELYYVQREEALHFLSLAIDTIKIIKGMDRELSQSYCPPTHDVQFDELEGQIVRECTQAEIEESEITFISQLKVEVQRFEVELEKAMQEVALKVSDRPSLVREKIKLELTVDEMGILFSALIDNKIIKVANKKAFARLVADTFSSKDKDQFVPDNFYNKLSTFQPIPLDNMEQSMENMLDSIRKYRAKILR